jgi:microsomal dipeptidase-like Zn-dependent dipeptidase
MDKDLSLAKSGLETLSNALTNLQGLSDSEKLDLLPKGLLEQLQGARAAVAAFGQEVQNAAEKPQKLINAEEQLATALERQEKLTLQVARAERTAANKKTTYEAAMQDKKALEEKIAAIQRWR